MKYQVKVPSVNKGIRALRTEFERLTALTSIGVRSVHLNPLPGQPPKFGS